MFGRGYAAAAAFTLAAMAFGRDAGRAGEGPFIKQDVERRDAKRGVIERSDGTVYGGLIYGTREAPIEMYDPEKKVWLAFKVPAIRKIEVSIDKEDIRKEWKFREGGKDDKVYTGRAQLHREYKVAITWEEKGETRTASGRVRGGPVYVEHWDGQKYKFLILCEHSGEYTSADKVEKSLVYTKTVDFTRDPDEVKKQMDEAKKKKEEEAKKPDRKIEQKPEQKPEDKGEAKTEHGSQPPAPQPDQKSIPPAPEKSKSSG
jgi:hypothetical protein